MKRIRHTLCFLFLLECMPLFIKAQVAINNTGATPDTSAMLDITSTTRGLLLPRLTNTEMTQVYNPAIGLMVFNTTAQKLYNRTAGGWEVAGITSPIDTAPANNTLYSNGTAWVNSSALQHNGLNTGIGQAPELSWRLGITGNVKVTGNTQLDGNLSTTGAFQLNNGSAAAGKVLTASDASGNASWQTNTGGVANRLLTIPFTAFSATNGFASSLQILSSNNYAHFNNATSGNAHMVAPVYLPAGAVVTRMSAVYNDASAADMTFQLVKTNYEPAGGSIISQFLFPGFKTSGSVSGFFKISSNTISHTVLGLNNTYYVEIATASGANWPGNSLLIVAIEIEYTY